MNITHIHSYLVKAEKGVETQSAVSGTHVPQSGRMYIILREIYEKATDECEHDILFLPNSDGEQQNSCRDLITAYIARPTLTTGNRIARHLQQVTTKKSGLGLLFLILGTEGARRRLVVSRFPADEGILAEENSSTLSVKYVERIFMKNAKTYKAALYEGVSPDEDFWTGKAVDRQTNDDLHMREYWIKEFLISDYSTTGERGTRTLATALKEVHNDARTPAHIKQEIASAITLSRTLDQQSLSPIQFARRSNLSPGAQEAILSRISPNLQNRRFRLSIAEMDKIIAFKVVELDSGAHLSAPTANFDSIFTRTATDAGNVRFSAEGHIVDETIRKAK